MLSLKHLSKSYVRGKPVLNDINLEIAARGITAIIGPSGTGKSTLIRCINRLVEPSAGAVVLDGVCAGSGSAPDRHALAEHDPALPHAARRLRR